MRGAAAAAAVSWCSSKRSRRRPRLRPTGSGRAQTRRRSICVQPSGPRKSGRVGALAKARTQIEPRSRPCSSCLSSSARKMPRPRALGVVAACTENCPSGSRPSATSPHLLFPPPPPTSPSRTATERTRHCVLHRDHVAGPGEHQLEGPGRIWLDVVPPEAEAVARGPVRAGDRRERDPVARLLDEARVLGTVVRVRALDEGERLDFASKPLLEAEFRERDLARGLRRIELRERTVPDSVRLDADPTGLELGELRPVDGLVADAEEPQRLLVRERALVVEEADRDEEDGGIPVTAKNRQGVLEVVAVAVVEGEEHGPRGQ